MVSAVFIGYAHLFPVIVHIGPGSTPLYGCTQRQTAWRREKVGRDGKVPSRSLFLIVEPDVLTAQGQCIVGEECIPLKTNDSPS